MSLEALKKLGKKYDGKVAKLLHLGRKSLRGREKISYVDAFGFTEEDIPQLMALAQDEDIYGFDYSDIPDDEGEEFYGVIHAWNALSEMKVPEFKRWYLKTLEETDDEYDDWRFDKFVELMTPFFDKALFDYFIEKIMDPDVFIWTRIVYTEAVEEMLEKEIAPLSKIDPMVEKVLNESDDGILNAFIIGICAKFQLTHHHALIKACFERDTVDIMHMGDLEDVEIEMGLRKERETPRPSFFPFPDDLDLSDLMQPDHPEVTQPFVREEKKIGRNDPCPCGSGKKYKKCCMNKG